MYHICVPVCVCVSMSVSVYAGVFLLCGQIQKEDIGCRPLLLSTLFGQTGFLIRPDICLFFFSPSLAGQRVPEISLCLFPVLRLQIHMMWAAGKLQCSLCLQQSLHFLLEIQTLFFLLKEQVSLLRDPSPHPLETDLHSHHSRHHHLAGSCRLRTECGP